MKRLVCLIAGIVLVAFLITISATAEDSKRVNTKSVSKSQVNPKFKSDAILNSRNPGIPSVMSYFGYLEDNSGNPVTGTKSMEFSIWDALTGGTLLWSESHSNVEVKNGHFSLLLGETNPISSDIFTSGTERWIEVTVETEILTPRTRISTIGYGYVTEQADNATTWAGYNWGDLYLNANATKLQNQAISTTAPSSDQVLKWDGSQWAPGEPPGGPPSGSAGGDLAGTYPNPTVAKIQTRAVSTTVPTSGEVLKWEGSQWAPGTDETGGTGYWTRSSTKLYPNSTDWIVCIGANSPIGFDRLYVEANGKDYGIWSRGDSGKTAAIYGEANGAWCGVQGYGSNTSEAGVYGLAIGANYGVYGQGSSDKSAGVRGDANGASYGVYGQGSTDKSAGVYGIANGAYIGVCGIGSSDKIAGVKGMANGALYGVYGQGFSGKTAGIYGQASGANYGVYGQGYSGDTAGVYGEANGALYGVQGYGSSTSEAGVYGSAFGADYGVYGKGSGGRWAGVYGNANGANYGVYGKGSSNKWAGVYGVANGAWYGVYGKGSSNKWAGVYGDADSADYGVYGQGSADGWAGVKGNANGAYIGVNGVGSSDGWAGVKGDANGANYGVYGAGSTDKSAGICGYAFGADYGVYGAGSTDEIAGVYGNANGAYCGVLGQGISKKFAGVKGDANGASYGVYSVGDFGCSGLKLAVVRTSKGPTGLYCIEAPDIWFEDLGSGQLINGRCHIELDQLFLETVSVDANNPMKVFIQLNDDCKGVYVRKGISGFDVIELQGGISNARFDYKIMAKRKGYEERRLKVVESCYMDRSLYPDDNDPSIPPEWREKRIKEREAETKMNESLKQVPTR
ncbi:MAG: hypothetical protein U9N06_01345 [candidate division WOR-3 bacterium]|nr:hypothetical protein [candidate division WOR-3 bacterium]